MVLSSFPDPQPPNPDLTPRDRLIRAGILGVCLSLLLATAHNAWGGGHLGKPCTLKHWVGIPCPTWGMTRAWVATLRGDLTTALHFHAFGPLFVLLSAIAVIHISLELLRRRLLQMPYSPFLRAWQGWVVGLAIYLGHHGLRLLHLSQTGELRQFMAQSVMGQLLHW